MASWPPGKLANIFMAYIICCLKTDINIFLSPHGRIFVQFVAYIENQYVEGNDNYFLSSSPHMLYVFLISYLLRYNWSDWILGVSRWGENISLQDNFVNRNVSNKQGSKGGEKKENITTEFLLWFKSPILKTAVALLCLFKLFNPWKTFCFIFWFPTCCVSTCLCKFGLHLCLLILFHFKLLL